jgi:hypothetical protein
MLDHEKPVVFYLNLFLYFFSALQPKVSYVFNYRMIAIDNQLK